jgi:hypothetical protein
MVIQGVSEWHKGEDQSRRRIRDLEIKFHPACTSWCTHICFLQNLSQFIIMDHLLHISLFDLASLNGHKVCRRLVDAFGSEVGHGVSRVINLRWWRSPCTLRTRVRIPCVGNLTELQSWISHLRINTESTVRSHFVWGMRFRRSHIIQGNFSNRNTFALFQISHKVRPHCMLKVGFSDFMIMTAVDIGCPQLRWWDQHTLQEDRTDQAWPNPWWWWWWLSRWCTHVPVIERVYLIFIVFQCSELHKINF